MLWILEKSQWLNWKKTDFQVKGALNFFLLGNGVQGRVKFRETIICKEGSKCNQESKKHLRTNSGDV